MSSTRFHRVSAVGFAALAVAGLVSGCNSSKAKSSAVIPTSATPTVDSPVASTTTPSSPVLSGLAGASSLSAAESAVASALATAAPSPTKVVATGGGTFCKEVAASENASLAHIAAGGITPAAIKAEFASYHTVEGEALSIAPSSLKPDLVVLFGATDKIYAAIAAANYDFTKINPASMTGLDTPQVKAAEANINAYMKNTCGINTPGS